MVNPELFNEKFIEEMLNNIEGALSSSSDLQEPTAAELTQMAEKITATGY